jgi:hypothetical protein
MRNRRGDIGFMEAMVAAMAVTVVLAAFTGVVVSKVFVSDLRPGYPDIREMADSLYVSDGEIQGNLDEELEIILMRTGLNGISVSFVPVPDKDGNPVVGGELYFSAGNERGHVSTERILCSVSKDGGNVLVRGELRVWSR